ncbi:hypothetical protein E4M02_04420 [Brevundimonas sp. S30B]|uniref:hypothetical protein n=1 Tax=unclassified Brevundimonas TaxID=2622653 RepID=UPI001071B1D7|nr:MULTISPECIES: hypothetical protein [Brevundimonas]QBX36885.1 hypothetical protein E4M01_03395 [Brevundimonas sp. MF30-B]TFW04320.1 hypothetical protein E4M02_04420 [Brevundimonas sp. S30B]
MTYAPEELTPQRLAIMWDMWKRAEAAALKTRGDISQTRTRLHELENHLAKMEQDGHDAALFIEAYLIQRGVD